MIEALQDELHRILNEEAQPGKLLPTVQKVLWGEQSAVPDAYHPVIILAFREFKPKLHHASKSVLFEAQFQLEIHTLSFSYDEAERQLHRVMWSSDGQTGMIPVLRKYPAVQIGGQSFSLAAPEFIFGRFQQDTKTFTAAAVTFLTAKSMLG